MVESGEFVMFDYGCLENLRRYGQVGFVKALPAVSVNVSKSRAGKQHLCVSIHGDSILYILSCG